MTSASLIPRIKATETRARLRSSTARMTSGVSQLISFPNCGQKRTPPFPVGSAASAPSWVKTIVAAFLVVAGALALEALVLWVASARVIERLPF